MSDVPSDLADALRDRYRREVALEVLRPDLAASLGAEVAGRSNP